MRDGRNEGCLPPGWRKRDGRNQGCLPPDWWTRDGRYQGITKGELERQRPAGTSAWGQETGDLGDQPVLLCFTFT